MSEDQPLPDIQSVLPWRTWDAACVEARDQAKPITCWAEPAWANASQRLALQIGQDHDLREAILAHSVPALVSGAREPELVDRLRTEVLASGSPLGPPLLVLCSPDGRVLVPYPSMHAEGEEGLPSLRSLVMAVAGEVRARFAKGRPPSEGRVAVGVRNASEPSGSVDLDALVDAVLASSDPELGGFGELPKAPHATTLWLLLDLLDLEAGTRTREVESFLSGTLTAMAKGGIRDQISGGFHRCSRDRRWIVPHFEKIAPENARLAAVYQRAAARWDDPELARVAAEASAFARASLERSAGGLAADTFFYTWTSRQFSSALDPELQQAMGFHFHVTSAKTRHTLYQALDPHQMQAYSHETPERLAGRIERGRFQLLMARNQRRAPAEIEAPDVRWLSETATWLLLGARHGLAIDEPATVGMIRQWAEAASPSTEPTSDASGPYAADAWLAKACTAAFATTGEQRDFDRAQQLLERAEEAWVAFGNRSVATDTGLGLIDSHVSGAKGCIAGALVMLDAAHGERDPSFCVRARANLEPHMPQALSMLPWTGSACSAWLQLVA